ncbi:Rhomboid family protein [Enhygromyxa salina]|uniref:Rhomboid family protein n=1 Tax=Enhygromyxa salina TaxID=215803 RepID=A0A2S9Y2J8_9BACT|nr:Rhomboid family protein [Enhygromyxa salina]
MLLGAVACAATLVRLLRRRDGIGRGYSLVVGALLIFDLLAMGSLGESSRVLGVVALALVTVTVVLPWVLEHSSRWAFARGHLIWVGRLSSLRASLMPGSGLARQLPILEGLAVLDREGVDAALTHFRKLAEQAEDGPEAAVIHEQIVSMLFHGQRWDEGIAHYERRFHAGYAALRPSLALGLLRAYGEAGRLETAAGLLRELEDGPVGADPSTAELLGQARLTFLAYAGAVDPVGEIVARARFADLGLTAATAELFKGIAQARAGEPREAVETLTNVEALAGPRDRRVREAARSLLERARAVLPELPGEPAASGAALDSRAVELAPELSGYVDLVAARLRRWLSLAPAVHPHQRPLVTYTVMFALCLVYGVHVLRGGGGIGLLELGALSEDLSRGTGMGTGLGAGRGTGSAWARVFTSAWIHVDLVALLLDLYALWLAGQIVERMLGSARMAMVTLVAAVAGIAASVVALPLLWSRGLEGVAIVAPTGGNLMALGAITAALWLLLPSRTPALASRSRRNLIVTLALLLVANVVTNLPGLPGLSGAGIGFAPIALVVTIGFASAITLAMPLEPPRWLAIVQELNVGAALLATGVAAVIVIQADPETYLVDHRAQRCELDGVVVHTPSSLMPLTEPPDLPYELPLVEGLVDALELRDGSLVQLAVHRQTAISGDDGDRAPALFGLVDGLAGEVSATALGPLPEPFVELVAADPAGRWGGSDLWRNGERVGRVIEKRIEGPAGERVTLMLIASPATAIEHAPRVYAAIMREAELAVSAGEDPSPRVQCVVE